MIRTQMLSRQLTLLVVALDNLHLNTSAILSVPQNTNTSTNYMHPHQLLQGVLQKLEEKQQQQQQQQQQPATC